MENEQVLTAEAQPENQLQVIVRESGLEQTKAQVILTKFQDYFALAADWEVKARTLVVTRPDQKAEMKMAREGRLYLQKRRMEIENTRKELKEQALREGKAIDGIANILKALIVPIEEHLDKQEHFVEIQQKLEDERLLAEAKKRQEEERLAKEKADHEEQERVRLENLKLKAEAEERERQATEDRRQAEETLAAERRKAAEAAKAAEEQARKERESAEAERRKLEAEKKAAEDKAAAERRKADAAKVKLSAAKAEVKEFKAEVKALREVICPACGHKFNPAQEVAA